MISIAPYSLLIAAQRVMPPSGLNRISSNFAHWRRQLPIREQVAEVSGSRPPAPHGREAARQPSESDTNIGSRHTLILPSMQLTVSPPTQISMPARST